MKLTPYPECVPSFVEEYKDLVENLGGDPSDDSLIAGLTIESEWTQHGATTLVMLARQYGTVMLANALALAEAVHVEDGAFGL